MTRFMKTAIFSTSLLFLTSIGNAEDKNDPLCLDPGAILDLEPKIDSEPVKVDYENPKFDELMDRLLDYEVYFAATRLEA